MQISIPTLIGDFFHGIDITKYVNIKDLKFIAYLTPCNKILDECVYLNRDFFYKISTYIESVAIIHLIHDKEERAGLVILIEVLGFNS